MDETSDGKYKVQQPENDKWLELLKCRFLATHPQYHRNRSKCQSGTQDEERPGALIKVSDHDCIAVGRFLWHRRNEKTVESFSWGPTK